MTKDLENKLIDILSDMAFFQKKTETKAHEQSL